MAPLVSVVTNFLNAGEFITESIESVFSQTYPHWELLLVDDGSTDASSEIARGFAARHPDRIQYLEHPGHQNRGMSASRNLGVRHGRGELIALLDADDVWLPHQLETHVALMRTHPKAALVTGPTQLWYGWTGKPQDALRDGTRAVTQEADKLYQPPELLRSYLDDKALTPATCSVLVKREAFERIGGFDERFTGMYDDQVFFLKAYLHLPIYVTSVCTDRYRQHFHSYSAQALRTGQYFNDRPGPALVGLFVWLARYLASQRVRDRIIWTRLLGKFARIGLNRGMTTVNRPLKRVMALWYEARAKGQE